MHRVHYHSTVIWVWVTLQSHMPLQSFTKVTKQWPLSLQLPPLFSFVFLESSCNMYVPEANSTKLTEMSKRHRQRRRGETDMEGRRDKHRDHDCVSSVFAVNSSSLISQGPLRHQTLLLFPLTKHCQQNRGAAWCPLQRCWTNRVVIGNHTHTHTDVQTDTACFTSTQTQV